MKKVLKIIGAIILALIVLITILYIGLKIYISMNLDDEDLNDDSHMILKTADIPDEENAWFDLKKAGEAMYYPKDKEDLIKKMSSGEEWNEELAKQITEKNQDACKYIEASLNKKYLANPSFKGLKEEDYSATLVLESANFIRKLNRIYLISAKNSLLAGDFNKGLEEISNDLSLGNKFKNSSVGTTLIEYLIGLAVSENAYSLIENINSDFPIYKENSIILQKKLEESKNNKEGLAEVFKFEYLIMRNEANNLSSKEYLKENIPEYSEEMSSRFPFYLKKNKFRNMILRKFERDVENSHRSCDNLIPFEKEVDLSNKNKLALLFTENAIGKILIDITSISFDSVQEKRCKEDFRVTALQVQLAANAYKADNGNYPESIRDLEDYGYLAVEMPANLHGWNIKYDKNTGKLIFPENIKK